MDRHKEMCSHFCDLEKKKVYVLAFQKTTLLHKKLSPVIKTFQCESTIIVAVAFPISVSLEM